MNSAWTFRGTVKRGKTYIFATVGAVALLILLGGWGALRGLEEEQVLLEQLGGGGNKSAAGVQLPDITLRDAVNRLFAAIDEYFATE